MELLMSPEPSILDNQPLKRKTLIQESYLEILILKDSIGLQGNYQARILISLQEDIYGPKDLTMHMVLGMV